ncbi:unnamed protein product [Ilex paraguariensis]
MKEKKSGYYCHSFWLCCSKKEKKKAIDTYSDSSTDQDDVSSTIFGPESKGSCTFICCSMIDGSPSSPEPLHAQKIDYPSDMGMARSALAVVPVPPHRDV